MLICSALISANASAAKLFQYDEVHDRFICLQGHALPLWKCSFTEETFVYRADAATCDAYPVKAHCTDSKSGRHVCRSFFQVELDHAASDQETAAFEKAMNRRKVWPELLFGEAK